MLAAIDRHFSQLIAGAENRSIPAASAGWLIRQLPGAMEPNRPPFQFQQLDQAGAHRGQSVVSRRTSRARAFDQPKRTRTRRPSTRKRRNQLDPADQSVRLPDGPDVRNGPKLPGVSDVTLFCFGRIVRHLLSVRPIKVIFLKKAAPN